MCVSRVEQSRECWVACLALFWTVYIWRYDANVETEAGQRGHSGSVGATTLGMPRNNTLQNKDASSVFIL